MSVEALLDLAIHHAQEIQRNIELDHERVDQHEVAQRDACPAITH
jgi:hypothetical protein